MYVRQEALPVAPFAATPASCTASRVLYCSLFILQHSSSTKQDAVTELRAFMRQQTPMVCCRVYESRPCYAWTWDCRPLLVTAGGASVLLAPACGALNGRVPAQLMAEGLPL
jgi:hypothetical protein